MWFFPKKKQLTYTGGGAEADAPLSGDGSALASGDAGLWTKDDSAGPRTQDFLFAEAASISSDLHEHLLSFGRAGAVLPNRDPLLAQQQPDSAYAWPYGLFEEALDKDAHLAALLAQRKAAVLGWERSVQPADDTPRARAVADFVEAALEGIGSAGSAPGVKGGGFERDLAELLDAIAYGFAVSEVIWERRELPPAAQVTGNRGQGTAKREDECGGNYTGALPVTCNLSPVTCVVPAELRSRHPRRFVFALREGGFEARLLTSSAPVEGEALPPRKLLLFSPYGRFENPYGQPLLRPVWWLAWFKRHALKYWVMYCEKFGAPTAVLQYPLGATEREKRGYKRVIAGLQQETGLVLPEGVQLSLLEAQRSGTVQTYSELLHFCNEEMSKALLGQTLTVEAGERGARSLGEVHLAVRGDIVRCDAQALMALVNGQLIPWIVELNFGPGEALPRWQLSPPRSSDLALQLEIDRFFAERGLYQDETEMYARYGRKPGSSAHGSGD
ncbi:DUF935 family protein [bacterium]|nr:DUF935 family protein [bacterium]